MARVAAVSVAREASLRRDAAATWTTTRGAMEALEARFRRVDDLRLDDRVGRLEEGLRALAASQDVAVRTAVREVHADNEQLQREASAASLAARAAEQRAALLEGQLEQLREHLRRMELRVGEVEGADRGLGVRVSGMEDAVAHAGSHATSAIERVDNASARLTELSSLVQGLRLQVERESDLEGGVRGAAFADLGAVAVEGELGRLRRRCSAAESRAAGAEATAQLITQETMQRVDAMSRRFIDLLREMDIRFSQRLADLARDIHAVRQAGESGRAEGPDQDVVTGGEQGRSSGGNDGVSSDAVVFPQMSAMPQIAQLSTQVHDLLSSAAVHERKIDLLQREVETLRDRAHAVDEWVRTVEEEMSRKSDEDERAVAPQTASAVQLETLAAPSGIAPRPVVPRHSSASSEAPSSARRRPVKTVTRKRP
jgi:chromosome segregation ATPase